MQAGRPGPLAGIRVLDLTTAWAGPMAGRILAFLGADVIHVEHATRVDLWRHHRQLYRPWLYADGDGGPRPYNRNALFNSQNINKRSLCLDLRSQQGLQLGLDLARQTDVVLSNFTPGALDRLGFGFAALSRVNPRIIVAEMPAYGSSGPKSGAPAVGATMELAAGMAGMIGYAGGRPTTTGPNYMDPIGGYNAAAGILTALVARQRSVVGVHVEIPQVEAAMQFIGEELLYAVASGEDPLPRGNRVRYATPHGAYPAAGDDEWIAIAVLDDGAWPALCRVIGADDWADDGSLAGLTGRQLREDEIDARLAGWTVGRDKHDAAALLQAAGVAAAPVLNAREATESPFLAGRGFFTPLDHPEAGRRHYQELPIKLSRTPGGSRRAAPTLGQDTEAILGELLGLGPAEIAALADDVTASTPV
jgi:crotonobetainyl-CoA:carnitine CoA-transferase CaiB-like acyl-CoA transferase